ncbi:MAG: alpha/beta hydrolase [Planctomycetota bacterium]|nr:alpha/beta hydrolase [Planctomycetota bacterium]
MPHVAPAAFLDELQTKGNQTRSLPEGVRFREDVVFGRGGEVELKLDLFEREAAPGRPRPAIVFIHGGGWQNGDKKQFFAQAAYLAWKHDFLAASIRYRLTDVAPFPACLQDAKCAVRWVRAHAGEWKLDPERIAVSGGSAGGHLTAMVALTPGHAELEGDGGSPGVSSHANAAIPFNGVMDLYGRALTQGARGPVLKLLGGQVQEMPERYKLASPLQHVTRSAPPMLLLHGDKDETVPHKQSIDMKARYDEVGAHAELEIYPGVPHGWFNAAPHFWTTLQRMEKFLVERFALQA